MKKKNITVTEIAKEIGLSISTVSRALSNHPKISLQTKEKVWSVAKKLGYQPKIPAYMERKSSKTIYFMVPDLKSQFHIDIIESIQKVALSNGYNVFLAYTNNNLKIEKVYAKSFLENNAAGIIITLFDKSLNIDHLNILGELKIPTVFINRSEQEQFSCTILPDISHGAYKAVKHLLSMGCKDVILFAGNPNTPYYADMIEGFQLALSAEKPEHKENIIPRRLKKWELEKYLNGLLKKGKLPDGIISPNNTTRDLIMNWLKIHNLKMPDDIKLISFSDIQKNTVSASKITTIHFSGTEIGELAAKKLFQQIRKGEVLKETVIIPAKFIIKSSSLKL